MAAADDTVAHLCSCFREHRNPECSLVIVGPLRSVSTNSTVLGLAPIHWVHSCSADSRPAAHGDILSRFACLSLARRSGMDCCCNNCQIDQAFASLARV